VIQRYQIGDQPKRGFIVRDVLHGGMGLVYVLHVPQSDLHVAMKTCDLEKVLPGGGVERIQNECLIWTSLPPHPNVVTAIAYENEGGLPTLLMEYLPGGNLRERLARGRLSHVDALRIASEVCEGMRFIGEANGVVHRDLKPENILFDSDGVAKITDFGLAGAFALPKLLEESEDGVGDGDARGRPSGGAGTAPYMAPEQFRSFDDVDTRADIYSMGVVLHEMFGGRRPFDERSVAAWEQAHRRQPPPALAPDVPERVRAVVRRCLAKDPATRFPSFEALAAELAACCRDVGAAHVVAVHHSVEARESAMKPDAWNQRGYSLTQLRRYDDAERAYRRGLTLALQGVDLGNTGRAPGTDADQPVNASTIAMFHDNLGALLLRMERPAEARAQFEAALDAVPDDATALLRLGQIAMHDGDVHGGLALIKKSTEIDPGNFDLILKYIRACHAAGEDEAYEAGFEEFLMGEADHPAFLVAVGCHHEDELGPEFALRCFRQALQADPDLANAWFNMGVTLHRLGVGDEAARHYRRALELNRDHGLARCYLGILLLESDEVEEASWQLSRFLETSEESAQANLIRMLFQLSELGMPVDSMLPLLSGRTFLIHVA
jgi:tetratricopeptide (TPR) repeat protein